LTMTLPLYHGRLRSEIGTTSRRLSCAGRSVMSGKIRG
jgi:hypothetical protein